MYIPTVTLAIQVVIMPITGGFELLAANPTIFVNDSLMICTDATDMITDNITIDIGSNFVRPETIIQNKK